MTDEGQDPRLGLLIALLYGELSPSEAEDLRKQIAGDPALRAEWEELQKTRSLLSRWDIPEAPPRVVFVHRTTAGGGVSDGAQRVGWIAGTPGGGTSAEAPGAGQVVTRPGRQRSLRRFLVPAFTLAAAALLLVGLGWAGLRVERIPGGLAFRLGREATSETPASVASRAAPAASMVTQTELDDVVRTLGRSMLVILADDAERRDRETGRVLQTAFTGLNDRQEQSYKELRARIEAVGLGLQQNQARTQAAIDYLQQQGPAGATAPQTVPLGTREGDKP